VYKIPKNPQTEIQQDQRDYMKNAVLAWHTDGYTIIDYEAWNLYTKNIKAKKTSFNCFLGFRINAEKSSKTWTKLTNCIISEIKGNNCIVEINVASDKTGILYIGKSKKVMMNKFIGIFSADHYTFTVTGLEKVTNYWFYIKNTSAGEEARTGIYNFKTTSEEPITHYNLDISVSPEGKGTTEPEIGIHEYESEEEVTIKAFPIEGYNFINWSGDKEGSENPSTIIINSNKNVIANFEEIPPTIIYIGVDPFDGNDKTGYGVTYINKYNPANDSGIITSIKLWAKEDIQNIKIGIFYIVSGNNLTCRSSQAIANQLAGEIKTVNVNLAVVAGDCIGIYFTGGALEKQDPEAGKGVWQLSGNQMSCINTTFQSYNNRCIMLYGIGST
jgi:hypothetical protein